MNEYVIKASWPATALKVKVKAETAEEAIERARKDPNTKGCHSLQVTEVR